MAPEIPLATFADRVWYAYHCLRRGRHGQPPSWRSLELKFGLANATFSKLATGEKTGVTLDALPRLARALSVSSQWLLEGIGDPPKLTGYLPSRKRVEQAYRAKLGLAPSGTAEADEGSDELATAGAERTDDVPAAPSEELVAELLSTVGGRAWYAYCCLPRGKRGRPPSFYSLEKKTGLAGGMMSRFINGERTAIDSATVRKFCIALNVDAPWLLEGIGEHPTLTGDLPPRPLKFLPKAPKGAAPQEAPVPPAPTRAPVVPSLPTGDAPSNPLDDFQAGRGAAVVFARACRWDERAIRAVEFMPVQPWSPEEWLALIRVKAAELRTVAHAPRIA
jgi:DNA-binding Xre family transcriptional regulator